MTLVGPIALATLGKIAAVVAGLIVVAYILKLNGMPAGKEALPSDMAALGKIRFDSPKKGP